MNKTRIEAFSDGVLAIIITMNVVSIAIAFFYPMISLLLTCIMAAIWIMPDKKIEALMDDE